MGQQWNQTQLNQYIITATNDVTKEQQFLVKCSNPYDSSMNDQYDRFGTGVAWANTIVFFICMVVGVVQTRFVSTMFSADSLREHFPPMNRSTEMVVVRRSSSNTN